MDRGESTSLKEYGGVVVCRIEFTMFYCNLFSADLNECETNPCSQECANVYGSYQCYCRRGYQLSDIDGMTCEGKMEPF